MELSLLTALVRPFLSFVNTSELLIWSVLDKTELNKWEAKTKVTTKFVNVLFCIFLIVSVIMLVNMLVALLTKTYDNITVSSVVARGEFFAYNVIYWEAPPEMGTFLRLQVYEWIRVSLSEVYERVGKSVIRSVKIRQKAQKG